MSSKRKSSNKMPPKAPVSSPEPLFGTANDHDSANILNQIAATNTVEMPSNNNRYIYEYSGSISYRTIDDPRKGYLVLKEDGVYVRYM